MMASFAAPIASAVEVGPTGNPTVIQTNGPNNPVHNGDFYSASGLSHLLEIDIPCTWPATWPLVVDMFSGEVQTSSVNDEILGASDDVRFVLTDPAGVVVADSTFGPNAGPEDYDRLVTLLPATCGVYLLEVTVSDDDQAGYKVRVGSDDDGDPNTPPPAGYDNVDGIPSTGDEVTIGMTRVSLQQDSGGDVCLPFYEYVQPDLPSIAFHNFDIDNSGSVAYYPPSAGVNFSAASLAGATAPPAAPGVITGTASGFHEWNNGTGSGATAVRGGDVITTPEDGWWTLVICVPSNNQFIFEGQQGVPMYFEKPTIPLVSLTKDDQQTEVYVGQEYTYDIAYENSDQTPTPMDIEEVTLLDTLPPELVFVGCSMSNPALSCSYDAANHQVNAFVGFMAAGDAGTMAVTVRVDAELAGTITNDVDLTYMAIGTNVFLLEASDTDTFTVPPPPTDPQLTIVKDDGQTLLAQGGTTTYVIDVANASADAAESVVVTDAAVAGITFTACRVVSGPAGSGCTIDALGNVSASLGTMVAASAARIEIDAAVGPLTTGTITNVATVDWTNDNGDQRTANDDDTDEVPPPVLPRTGTDLVGRFLSLAALLMVGGYSAVRASTGPMSRLPR